MKWLACCFRHFALCCSQRASANSALPLAIVENKGNRQWVVGCNRAASQLGVHADMPLRAALALAPGLCSQQRDAEAEHAQLRRLAAWLYQFSSQVSLQPPDAVVLEVQASERLFGGFQPLLKRIDQGLRELGFVAHMAVADSPSAALLLAPAQRKHQVISPSQLPQLLDQQAIEHCPLPATTRTGLKRVGIHQLSALRALPSDGVSRRFGADLLLWLDRLYGLASEPRTSYQPAQRYQSLVELPVEVHHCDGLLFVVQRLTRELCGILEGSDCCVSDLIWSFHHAQEEPTRLQTSLLSPSRTTDTVMLIVREQLGALKLPAPVRSIELAANKLLAATPSTGHLFDRSENREWPALLARLQARLGTQAVQQMSIQSDHRPECAWGYCGKAPKIAEHNFPPRPLWLLAKPKPWQGPASNCSSAERIESGWWDENDVRRDYHRVLDQQGRWVWAFRNRQTGQWFIHGYWH